MNEKIHQTLLDFLHGYIPTQEITHAASLLCQNPTEETVQEMTSYLLQFDKEFIAMQTVNTKSVTNNQVRYAMAEVRHIIEEGKTETTEEGN